MVESIAVFGFTDNPTSMFPFLIKLQIYIIDFLLILGLRVLIRSGK